MESITSFFQQENLSSLVKTIQDQMKTLVNQPVYAVVLLVIFLVGTQFLANILSTPFGIGVIIGVVGVFYYMANYGNKNKSVSKKK